MNASKECLPAQTLLLHLPRYFPSTPMSDSTHQPKHKQCQCRLMDPMCHTHFHISKTLEVSMLLPDGDIGHADRFWDKYCLPRDKEIR